MSLNYYGLSFAVLTLEAARELYGQLYYCVHILHFLAVLLVPLLVPKYPTKDKPTEKKAE